MAMKDWSQTAASNATAGTINFAEGQLPSTVNNSARALMSDVRTFVDDGGWHEWGDTCAYVGATQFKIAGADVTARYTVNRRVRAVGATPGTIYGTISVSSFATDTTVTVVFDSGSLSNEALVVSLSLLDVNGLVDGASIISGAIPTARLDAQLVDVAGLAVTDGGFIVGDGSNFILESGATLRTSVGVGTGDSPQFSGMELGSASDTTLTRTSAGDVDIEGNIVYRAGGTDVPVTDGGTGVSTLTDGGVLLGSGTGAVTAMAVLADGELIVGDGTTDPVAESGATLRTSIGVGTGDNVQFTDGTFTGNLTVSGTTTTVDTTNMAVSDPLIEMNTGAATNANDLGWVGERGSTGDNVWMGWDESADKFVVATTTATGASTGNITYAVAPFEASTLTGTAISASTSLALATGATVTGILDEDAMGSDSATQLATQQSIKAYTDSSVKSPGMTMTWETTTTDADQGAGKVWANNATLSSATILYFSDTTNDTTNINSFVDSFDDATSANSATIYIQEAGTGTAGVLFQVSGDVTSATGYSKVAVTHVATFGTLADTDVIGVVVAFSGDNGAGDMTAANNLSDVSNAATSFTNIKQAASATATGVVELATDAETNTGTSTVLAITPANLTAWTGDTAVVTLGTVATGVWNGTAVTAAYGGTGATTLTDGGVLLGSGTGAVTAMAVLADGEIIVGDGTTDPVAESGATARTSLGVPALSAANTFSKAQSGSITALTSTTNSIAVDAALNNHFSHTFTENTTLANPTNLVAGTSGSLFLTQHASAPKTLAFGSYYKFAEGTAPTVTATNSATDRIDYIVRTTSLIDCVWTGAIA